MGAGRELEKRLRQDVEAIALPQGRRVGTVGHEQIRRYLADRMAVLKLLPYRGESYELPYGKLFCNLAGVLPGRDRRASPLLVGAHYDSVIDAPCADDNAAAVAILLAIAGVLRPRELERDILFVCFDAEEPPYFLGPEMGSIRFFEDQMDARGVSAALIQDLTGHEVVIPYHGKQLRLPRVRDLLFITGMESHPVLRDLVVERNRGGELPMIATLNEHVGDMSDHHIFRENNIPYLFFSCGRWPHYHMPTDTPDRLNYRKMSRIARLLTVLVEKGSRFEYGGAQATDTVDAEIRLMKRALGLLLPILLKMAGVPELKTRRDLDDLATFLLTQGL